MMGYTEIRKNVAENAKSCPFCGWEPEAKDVNRTDSREYDEEYFGIRCKGNDCSAWYEDDVRTWMKPVAPGEEQERVQV